MEFVGNQINLKSVLATLTVAFFVGRIQLFDGTFPAAIALITVMAAVSTQENYRCRPKWNIPTFTDMPIVGKIAI